MHGAQEIECHREVLLMASGWEDPARLLRSIGEEILTLKIGLMLSYTYLLFELVKFSLMFKVTVEGTV